MATRSNQEWDDRILSALASLTDDGRWVTANELVGRLHTSRAVVENGLARLQQAGAIERVGPVAKVYGYRPRRSVANPPPPPAGVTGFVRTPGTFERPAPAAHIPASTPTPTPPSSALGQAASTGDAPTSRADSDFDPTDLDYRIITLPLQALLTEWRAAIDGDAGVRAARLQSVRDRTRVYGDDRFSVIIDLNVEYPGGLARARQRILDLIVPLAIDEARATDRRDATLAAIMDMLAPRALREISPQYLILRLRPAQIPGLIRLDRTVAHARGVGERSGPHRRAIYRIWPDNVVQRHTLGSTATIKADAARSSFGCNGEGIVWGVVDSGIDGTHPHFVKYRNLDGLPAGVAHQDFIDLDTPRPLVDKLGHGSHVAGIIAGAYSAKDGPAPSARIFEQDENGKRIPRDTAIDEIVGVAPQCKLVSLKVLDDKGQGGVTQVMAALEQVLRTNAYGKTILIHGVNLSLGYVYDPQWFACGHSPLCEVVNRLVRSGVCVVAAAGNSGYGDMDTKFTYTRAQGMPMSINDPGNAEHAITVGSTHRESPHTFGVSYFSSKGPTGDGRSKPDLLAPGEKIISCLSNKGDTAAAPTPPLYYEDSGTSMAAPHVSGAIAALLSVRREFIGQTEEIKRVLMDSALDLGRERSMQGSGLLNLFSALQSI